MGISSKSSTDFAILILATISSLEMGKRHDDLGFIGPFVGLFTVRFTGRVGRCRDRKIVNDTRFDQPDEINEDAFDW